MNTRLVPLLVFSSINEARRRASSPGPWVGADSIRFHMRRSLSGWMIGEVHRIYSDARRMVERADVLHVKSILHRTPEPGIIIDDPWFDVLNDEPVKASTRP